MLHIIAGGKRDELLRIAVRMFWSNLPLGVPHLEERVSLMGKLAMTQNYAIIHAAKTAVDEVESHIKFKAAQQQKRAELKEKNSVLAGVCKTYDISATSKGYTLRYTTVEDQEDEEVDGMQHIEELVDYIDRHNIDCFLDKAHNIIVVVSDDSPEEFIDFLEAQCKAVWLKRIMREDASKKRKITE
jgi:hypothetical protein